VERKTVYIVSLGCPKNLVDSEVITASLIGEGWEVTADPQDALLIVINTCAFVLPAKEESIDEIFRMAEMKEHGRCQWLVVAGCLPQRYGSALAGEIPEVDLFVGTGEVPVIAELVRGMRRGEVPRNRSCIGEPTFIMNASHHRALATPPYVSYLKIAEGCSNRCSYCVIPAVRGKFRSRAVADIIEEAEHLAGRGVKELILTAQDTTRYGGDMKGNVTLAGLLKELVAVSNIKWIRLLYTYPLHITDELLEIIAGEEKICTYLDIPVQHIDDGILAAMKRKGNSTFLRDVLTRTRRIIPDVAIRTSLIVGFPGETPRAFANLLSFVRDVRFDHLGVFTYSREEGTEAAQYPRQVSEPVKRARRDSIMEEQACISYDINKTLIGSEAEIVVEGLSDISSYEYVGRLRRQAPDIDGITYLKAGEVTPGDIVRCRITACEEYDLYAEEIVR
jgi:ribosomal protein S12 methylthiotransferase